MATILIIDDDDGVREVLTAMVNDAGHTAIAADGGESGIRKFEEERPDLVLTDIIMPDVDGLETISEIRLIDPEARIAAMSGGSKSIEASYYTDIAKKFGAMAVLAKPFLIATLVDTIETCLCTAVPHRKGSDMACSVHAGSAHAVDGMNFETPSPGEDK
jgi:two-component system, chemotaxis family, chemotaxis protein CheY